MADIVNLLAAASGVGAGVETDPNFNQTVLLLHGDGTDGSQNNTFLDSSTNNFTITRNGNTTQGTFSPFSAPDGRWSNYFDGATATRLTLASSTDFAFGTGAYTMEAFVYLSQYGSQTSSVFTTGSANNSIIFGIGNSGQLILGKYGVGDQIISSTGSVEINKWIHIAIVRTSTASNDTRLYVNGSVVQTGTDNNDWTVTTTPTIGGLNLSGYTVNGYVANLRVIKGGAITPTSGGPTSPFSTSTSNQVLLTCYGNRFADFNTATTAKTITVNGNPKVTPFSPFAPTAAYSASVNGGSGYFDGSGDVLYPSGTSADLALGSGDFTIEFWLYTPRGATRQYVLDNRSNGAGGFIGTVTGIGVIWGDDGSSGNGNQFRYFSQSSGTVIADADLLGVTLSNIANQWNHIAIVRSSGTVYGFLNGVRKNSVADATNFNVNTSISIGAAGDNFVGFLGNISNFRAVKGTAVYTGTTYTVPTAPLTAVSGTELLCNFTNAGIFDNTGKHNLETVGNAQIDTTVKKYGTGSMEFDGSGDALVIPASTELAPLTGDFTYEAWVRPATTNTTFRTVFGIDNYSAGQPFRLYQYGTEFRFYYTTSDQITSSAITSGTWYHLAITRSGSTVTFWMDGVSQGTATQSTSYPASVFRIGMDSAGTYPFSGFVDDLRITKGVARYTTTFTPPTKEFPDL